MTAARVAADKGQFGDAAIPFSPPIPTAMTARARLLLATAGAFLASVCNLPGPCWAQVQPGQTVSVSVTLVPNANTFEARRRSGETLTVRLFGADAPELSEPYGRKAQAAARRYIGDQTIRLEVVETGPYGRTVGRAIAGGGSLAKMLVRRGLARYDDQEAPGAPELSRLEERARQAGRGLWSEAD